MLDAALDADEQGLLFDDDVSPLPNDLGYRGPTACNAAGITYRQLDDRARTGLVEPTVRGATGSGTQRLYSFRDILLLKVIKRLPTPASRCSRSVPPSPSSGSAAPTT